MELKNRKMKMGYVESIFDSIYKCKSAGRTPLLIIMTRDVRHSLALETHMESVETPPTGSITFARIPVLLNDSIRDFCIIDDRRWYEQKF